MTRFILAVIATDAADAVAAANMILDSFPAVYDITLSEPARQAYNVWHVGVRIQWNGI